MSTWEPIIFWSVFGVLVLAGAWGVYRALFHDRSRGRPRCPKCWYDMTGAPSLTCPECGHDARTEQRLHKTRRRWRGAMVYLLLIAVSVYWIEVRARLFAFNEPIVSAAIPTTVRILAIFAEPDGAQWGDDNRTVIQRRVATGGDPTEKLWGWQRHLYIEGLYRRCSRLPADHPFGAIPSDTLFAVLLQSAKENEYAVGRLMRMVREHPNRELRIELLRRLPRIVPAAHRSRLRAELLDLSESLWPDFPLAGGFVFVFPAEEQFAIDDSTFERELAQVLEGLPATRALVARYVEEALRRRSPGGDAIVLAHKVASTPATDFEAHTRLLVMLAQSRIAGRPDPIRLTLTRESGGVRLQVIEAEPLPWLDTSRGLTKLTLYSWAYDVMGTGEQVLMRVYDRDAPLTITPTTRDIWFPLRLDADRGARIRVVGALGPTYTGRDGDMTPASNVLEFEFDGGAPVPTDR